MSGPEPPPSEARVSSSNHRPFPLILHPAILSARREARSPAGSGPCDVEQGPAKTALTILHKECFHLIRFQNVANAHTTKPNENYRLANNLTNSVRKSPENNVRH